MSRPARRGLWRTWARRAAALWGLWVGVAMPGVALAQITAAEFGAPTDRYAHGVLGDAIEWGSLTLSTADGRRLTLTLPQTRVFEDLAPRVITTMEGRTLAMVVETDMDLGARLSLYDEEGLFAATPYIGSSNRWLAPIGAADLDGDGQLEIAYVDRPHLAKTIRIWRLQGRELVSVAALPGYTNHRIGEDTIAGGMRTCAGGPEMIVADAAWRDVVALRWNGRDFSVQSVEKHRGRSSFARALRCE